MCLWAISPKLSLGQLDGALFLFQVEDFVSFIHWAGDKSPCQLLFSHLHRYTWACFSR